MKNLWACVAMLSMYLPAWAQQPDSSAADTAVRSYRTEPLVITGTLRKSYLSQSPVKVEVFTQHYLRRNNEASLPDALLGINGVQQTVGCGVCGTTGIQLAGLQGPYTLTLIDGMPIMGALSSVYGLSGISTDIIERIEVMKGAASTLYGTEAIGGIINVITRHPGEGPRYSLHSYGSSHGEYNLDLATNQRLGSKLSTLISLNHYGLATRADWNGDGFMDVPLSQRTALFTKWQLQRPQDRVASLAVKYYYEDRLGGQLGWQREHRGGEQVYGESIYTNRAEVLGSYSLPTTLPLRLDFSYNHHHQDSYYGSQAYLANQHLFFANLIWQHTKGRHQLLAGATLRYQHYDDNSPATAQADARTIPGLFVEDEIRLHEQWKLLLGARLDHHALHGPIFSPRINVQWRPRPMTNIRLNAGTGFRVVNVFTEDHAALTGARQVVFAEALQPERAYNTLLSIDQTILLGESVLNLTADAFYTYFTNQIIPDYERDPNLIVYANLEGAAVARGASFAVKYSLKFPLSIEAGLTYQDVQRSTTTGQQPVLLIPQTSGSFTLSYSWRRAGFTLDYVGRVTGPMQLPSYDAPFERPTTSPWYSQHNVQVRKGFGKKWELYLGIKNFWNYTQDSPLVDPANPFGNNFDTAYVYGPLQPRRVQLGLRVQW